MKRIRPRDLVKPCRPILVGTSGMTREKLKERLIEVLRMRGIRVSGG